MITLADALRRKSLSMVGIDSHAAPAVISDGRWRSPDATRFGRDMPAPAAREPAPVALADPSGTVGS